MRAFDSAADILDSVSLVERFLRYVRFDTQSDESSETCPSTAKQLDLARHLVEELESIGLDRVALDENGYVIAELRGNAAGELGLIAHLDTAPAFPGAGVRPRIHEHYDGAPIRLEDGVSIDPAECPELLECRGDTLITSDGTTLLGADDKAGIAEIVSALEVLARRPEIRRPTIRICFNPDEEIGRGAHRFPLKSFGAPTAVTVDGGFLGEINVETFSADKATVALKGIAVHPGQAKGKMVNALTYMGKLLGRLPHGESPEGTEGRQGFFHATAASGDAAACRVELILRDFDTAVLGRRGERLRQIAESLAAEEPRLHVSVEIVEQYRNMMEELSRPPRAVERLRASVEAAGVRPRLEAIRGGTDGAQLTARGLPTPNLFAGGVHFHGPREWVSTRVMALATCAILNLVQLHAGD